VAGRLSTQLPLLAAWQHALHPRQHAPLLATDQVAATPRNRWHPPALLGRGCQVRHQPADAQARSGAGACQRCGGAGGDDRRGVAGAPARAIGACPAWVEEASADATIAHCICRHYLHYLHIAPTRYVWPSGQAAHDLHWDMGEFRTGHHAPAQCTCALSWRQFNVCGCSMHARGV